MGYKKLKRTLYKQLPLLSGFVVGAYNPAVQGSITNHTIYAFKVNFYCICHPYQKNLSNFHKANCFDENKFRHWVDAMEHFSGTFLSQPVTSTGFLKIGQIRPLL